MALFKKIGGYKRITYCKLCRKPMGPIGNEVQFCDICRKRLNVDA